MPIMTQGVGPGRISGTLPALPGLAVQVTAPEGTATEGVPAGGALIGWVLVDDPDRAGGARIDPVFLAAGQAWTPDQYRAAYGQHLTVRVGRQG